MESSIKFGKLLGIEIGIHWSWIFIFLLVTWSFATGVLEFYTDLDVTQRWIIGAGVSIIFFLSILAHEMSHALMATRLGLPVKGITLFVFGGVSNLGQDPEKAGDEFKIAIVGPLTSAVLAVAFIAGFFAIRPLSSDVAIVSLQLGIINAALAVFNMLPGFPLDGGRVFRSLIWSRNRSRLRSTRTASRVGEGIAYFIMGLGVVSFFLGAGIGGIWFLLIGFFLRNASAASYQQTLLEATLAGIRVRDVMRPEMPQVPPEMTVQELVQEHFFRTNSRCFAVMAAGDMAGVITLTDVRKLPREEWPTTSVYRAMTPATQVHTTTPNEQLADVVRVLAGEDLNQLPVMDGRDLVGVLTRGDIMRFIQLRQDLGEETLSYVAEPRQDDVREEASSSPWR
jgi:Zn-dependent protease/predicted transcriptional regulator